MKGKFEKGVIVRLKGGGPEMIVVGTDEKIGEQDIVGCLCLENGIRDGFTPDKLEYIRKASGCEKSEVLLRWGHDVEEE